MPKLKPGTIWPKPAKVELTQEQIDKIADTDMTFSQVEEKYGEENAILVGIARDPDNPEWTDEDWARARPAIEVHPELVKAHRRARAQGKKIPMIEHVSIPLDAHLVRRLEKTDPNWKTRVNDILRKTLLSP
ncbi:MAG: BrnA antitoxin family protein [Dehalococcoidia bacterium]|nr:BrnA antitoxin family protein [Dehalococcoidia bacterium]